MKCCTFQTGYTLLTQLVNKTPPGTEQAHVQEHGLTGMSENDDP